MYQCQMGKQVRWYSWKIVKLNAGIPYLFFLYLRLILAVQSWYQAVVFLVLLYLTLLIPLIFPVHHFLLLLIIDNCIFVLFASSSCYSVLLFYPFYAALTHPILFHDEFFSMLQTMGTPAHAMKYRSDNKLYRIQSGQVRLSHLLSFSIFLFSLFLFFFVSLFILLLSSSLIVYYFLSLSLSFSLFVSIILFLATCFSFYILLHILTAWLLVFALSQLFLSYYTTANYDALFNFFWSMHYYIILLILFCFLLLLSSSSPYTV